MAFSCYNESVNKNENNLSNILRQLPSVTLLLEQPAVKACTSNHGPAIVSAAVRRVVDEARKDLTATIAPVPTIDQLVSSVCHEVEAMCALELPEAINASGVILHTALGRARMAPAAAKAVYKTALNHSLVELDDETGKRGNRQDHVAELLRALTGAEETLAVNNCAAAVFLAISALAHGREVIISRGQMVEIGGGFRLPEIIEAAGARLREVGTTNKTRIGDYAAAINNDTAMILRCHPSNFAMTGFVEETSIAELSVLGRRAGVIVMDDQGNGNLHRAPWADSTVRASVQAGAGLVTFSGDKLMGGPQCGVVAGSAVLVHQLSGHPLARAMRIDKLSLAGLRATLVLHLSGEAGVTVPALHYMNRDVEGLKRAARRMCNMIARAVPQTVAELDLRISMSEVGGGSMPHYQLPTWCVVVKPVSVSVENFAASLRQQRPAVIARIRDDCLWLDPRTMERHEIITAVEAVRRALMVPGGEC